MRNPILAEFVQRRGATKRIAQACGVSHAAVSQWKAVPAKHVATVARLIGTTPEALRPDLALTSVKGTTNDPVTAHQHG